MNKIKILSDRIIIDDHADTREQCETATMLANLLLAQGSGFNCVEYRSGYAEFKKSDVAKLADSELKFAPAIGFVTMIFDSHISAVNSRSPMTVNWTSSGETQDTAAFDGTTYTFDVVLSNGYVIDTVALSSSDESQGKLTEKTDTTFSILAGAGGINQTITLTSKSAAVKNYIISSSKLTAIADATRAKSNITTKLTPAQIAEKINNLTIVANIDTADKMATLLVAENEGNVYKYVGTTTADYINGDLYAVEKVAVQHTLTWVSDGTLTVKVNDNIITQPYNLVNGDKISLSRTSGSRSVAIITDAGSYDTDSTASPLTVNNSNIRLQDGEVEMSPSMIRGYTINYTE